MYTYECKQHENLLGEMEREPSDAHGPGKVTQVQPPACAILHHMWHHTRNCFRNTTVSVAVSCRLQAEEATHSNAGFTVNACGCIEKLHVRPIPPNPFDIRSELTMKKLRGELLSWRGKRKPVDISQSMQLGFERCRYLTLQFLTAVSIQIVQVLIQPNGSNS